MSDHDWKPDLLIGEGPILQCGHCGQIWRPHQFKPRNPCPVTAARDAVARSVAAALKTVPAPSTGETP